MGAWIEINVHSLNGAPVERSHPTMGAWIEICQEMYDDFRNGKVAPHDGCVD